MFTIAVYCSLLKIFAPENIIPHTCIYIITCNPLRTFEFQFAFKLEILRGS